ncbi:MAG TPA: hypothetical protein VHS58_18610 [Acetobacteraceae bacterium]|jgi:hypothetical protein|nr:hypothetical protein [Acetobacteraceae bacterium]
MNTFLVVVRPFGSHAKGDVITDAATIAATSAGENAAYVVRVIAAPPPEPQKQGG